MKKMKESDAVKDYATQLLSIADKVKLLGKEFSNEKIIQKILVTLPEKYKLQFPLWRIQRTCQLLA